MTYEEAVGHIDGLSEARVQPGLARIAEALRLLGQPHRRFPHVLVGGTNGKGSTASFLAAILAAAGFRAGLYTSPHLVRFEERIRVEGEPIAPADLAALADEVRGTGVDLSYFEFATALALLHFARREVDAAVLEVGLGGRWDAVNATDPVLSVITNISRDHTAWLGETVEAIAGEKAPIMRPWAPVVIGRVEGPALGVLEREAWARQTPVFRLGRDFSLRGEEAGGGRDAGPWRYHGLARELSGLSLGLPGRFQADNAACALAAAELLDREGLCIPEDAARRGAGSARWPARFQLFPGTPPVLLDVAHNPAGMRALIDSLGGSPGDPAAARPVWIFSALSDKEVEELAALIAPRASRVVVFALAHSRAAGLARLLGAFGRWPGMAEEAASPADALSRARRAAGPEGQVVVAGSSYLAGALLPLLSVAA